MAQSSGVYPAEPFNGLQCTYNITGATISKYDDVPGFTCTRSMVIQDIQRGGTLGISGSLSAGGYGATVTVTVSAGNKSNTGTYQVKPGTPMSFNQQVAIAKDANTASITVNMEGHYSMGVVTVV
jgi:fructose-1,6-bisphosphatase